MSEYTSSLQEAAQFMRQGDRYLVISHVSPDGDTTSSALAVALMLEQLGKSCVIVNEGETPQKFDFLPQFQRIVNVSQDQVNETFDYCIAVDAADSSRMGDVRHLFAAEAKLLNIDHHPTNDRFGALNVIRTDAAATAEMIYDLLEAGNFQLTESIATCIYTGLLTDTGGFRYSNTTPRVMEIASTMLRYGVKPGEIAERCLEAITKEHVQLLRRALQSLRITHRGLVAALTITYEDLQETRATSEDAGGIVNYGRNIEGVEVGILITEVEPDLVKVSFRSRRDVNVAEIAKHLGGGGHARAAGCTIQGNLTEILEDVMNKLSEALGVGRDE